MTYCSECGQPLVTPTAKFCSACGTAVPSASTTTPTSAVPGPAAVSPALAPVSPRVQPRQSATPQATGPARSPAPPRRRGRVIVVVVLVIAGLVAAFMLGARSNDETVANDPMTSDTVPVEPGPASTPGPGAGPTLSPDGGQSTTSAMPSQPPAPVMPSVIGMVLQDAQDLLQSQGSYLMDQVDATGGGRFQFFDTNWKVCSQEPSAGTPLSSVDVVTLNTVKLDESCP